MARHMRQNSQFSLNRKSAKPKFGNFGAQDFKVLMTKSGNKGAKIMSVIPAISGFFLQRRESPH